MELRDSGANNDKGTLEQDWALVRLPGKMKLAWLPINRAPFGNQEGHFGETIGKAKKILALGSRGLWVHI